MYKLKLARSIRLSADVQSVGNSVVIEHARVVSSNAGCNTICAFGTVEVFEYSVTVSRGYGGEGTAG